MFEGKKKEERNIEQVKVSLRLKYKQMRNIDLKFHNIFTYFLRASRLNPLSHDSFLIQLQQLLINYKCSLVSIYISTVQINQTLDVHIAIILTKYLK